MNRPSDEFFPDTAFPANQNGRIRRSDAADGVLQLLHFRAVTNEVALDRQLAAKCLGLVARPGQTVLQGFPLLQVFESQRELIGHGHREFEVIDVERAVVFRCVEMDDTEDRIRSLDRSADHAASLQFLQASGFRQFRIVFDVPREDAFAARQNAAAE